jgi:hypothetical protein
VPVSSDPIGGVSRIRETVCVATVDDAFHTMSSVKHVTFRNGALRKLAPIHQHLFH